MKPPASPPILIVVVVFCWSFPLRNFDFTPRFHHPVVMAPPDGPYDRWYLPPRPLQLCYTNLGSSIEANVSSEPYVRPAWISFLIVASWSFLIIADRSERTTLNTFSLILAGTPIAVVMTAIFASGKLQYERAEHNE